MEDDGDNDDDIWGDDDAVSYDRAIAEREWSRLHDTFGNVRGRPGEKKKKNSTGAGIHTPPPSAILMSSNPFHFCICSQDIEKELKKEKKAHCNRASIKVGQMVYSTGMNWEDFEG
jgi:hypothetical protein